MSLSFFNSDLNQPNIKLPKPLTEIIRLVHQTKWNLIKMRQELNRSYKEICIPLLEKCRFLLYEVKPAISIENEAFKKVDILYREPRVKTLVKKVIKDLKCGRHTSDIQKPEDIVNATIQSQSMERHKSNEDIAKQALKTCSSEGKLSDSKSDSDDVNNEIKNGGDKSTGEQTMSESYTFSSSKQIVDQKSSKNYMDLKTELEQKWNSSKLENDTISQEMKEQNEKKAESNLALFNLLNKLTEKEMRKVCNDNIHLINPILDFILQDTCDIETLRKAMYCQV